MPFPLNIDVLKNISERLVVLMSQLFLDFLGINPWLLALQSRMLESDRFEKLGKSLFFNDFCGKLFVFAEWVEHEFIEVDIFQQSTTVIKVLQCLQYVFTTTFEFTVDSVKAVQHHISSIIG